MRQKTTKEQKKHFLELHSKGLPTLQICREVGIKRDVGYRLIKKYGLQHNPTPKLLSDEEVKFIQDLYQQGHTIKDIHQKYFLNKCSDSTINNVVKNIARDRGRVSDVDNSYFSCIDCPRKAYWLGLLFADGCVCIGENSYSISIQLTKTDSYLLEQMALDLKMKREHPVRYYTSDTSFGKTEYGKIQFGSKQIANDLISLGCVPRKSYNLNTFPTLPEDLIRHFVRGYFDGDGTVSIDKKGFLHAGFSSTPVFLELLMRELNKELGLPIKNIYNTGGESYCICYNQTESEKLYHYMYVDDCVCLVRKQKKFQEKYK